MFNPGGQPGRQPRSTSKSPSRLWLHDADRAKRRQPALRLGPHMVAGLGAAAAANHIVAARQQLLLDHAEDLACRARLDVHEVSVLAAADALMSPPVHRRQQVWDASALLTAPEVLRKAPVDEDVLELPAASEGEKVVRA